MPSCPHCGAEEHLGVWFPRRKAEIVRKVVAAGRDGAWFEPSAAIHVHVNQINGMLEETDWTIRSVGHGTARYRLVKRSATAWVSSAARHDR